MRRATLIFGVLGALLVVAWAAAAEQGRREVDDDITTHVCAHDRHLESFRRRNNGRHPIVPAELFPAGTRTKRGSGRTLLQSWSPIRFHVDTSFLVGDAFTCYVPGDVVSIGTPSGPGPACNETVTDDCYLTCEYKHVYSTQVGRYISDRLLPTALDYLSATLSVDPIANMTLAGASFCGALNPLAIPSNYSTTPVDADMVLFVTARPTVGTLLAFASPCVYDPASGRPIAAHVNFAPNKIADLATVSRLQAGVATHELMHALGFTYSLYDDYLSAGGDLNNILRPLPVGTGSAQYENDAIFSPRVLAEARDYYDCPDLEGMPVENGGGLGTTGSHWEARVSGSEMMIGSSSTSPQVSRMTLALFEDTGWYTANYSMASPPLDYGRGAGCSFVRGRCTSTEWPSAYLCDSKDRNWCSYDRASVATCDLVAYVALPERFQYFADQPNLGGGDQLADLCPIPAASASGLCADPLNANATTDPRSGYEWSPLATCFESTLLIDGFQISGGGVAGCFAWACDSEGGLRIRAATLWLECTDDEAHTVPLYNGEFNCPGEDFAISTCGSMLGGATPWPTVTSVTPRFVSQIGGEDLTVTGAGFREGAYVDVAGIPCSNIEVVSDEELHCTTSSYVDGWLVSGDASVVVINPGRKWGIGADLVAMDRGARLAPGLLVVLAATGIATLLGAMLF